MTASSNLTAPSVMPAHEHARDWEIEEDLERLLAGMLALLCLALVAAYALEAFLHRRGVWWLPGSGATILLGVLVGCRQICCPVRRRRQRRRRGDDDGAD